MTEPRPVAAIDCGTNTVRLLIGALPLVALRESRIVRLGQGVDVTGELAPEALARAFTVIEEYAGLLADHGVPPERLRFCATSASRDARNAAEFTDGVRARLGVLPEVISGQEEARLSFRGAVAGLAAQVEEPVLVVDIGGGSTELVLGRVRSPETDAGVASAATPGATVSLDVGAVRLHERHLHDDPATRAQIAGCVRDIDAALDRAEAAGLALGTAATVVGVAGTSTTVAAGLLGLARHEPHAVGGARLPVPETHALLDRLVGAAMNERGSWGFVEPGRVDVIGAGALILDRVLRRTGVPSWIVSEADLLDGIAWSVLEERGP